MNAQEARRRTNEAQLVKNSFLENQYASLLVAVSTACKSGKDQVTFKEELDFLSRPLILSRLRENGFTVVEWKQPDNYSLTISW